MCTAVNFFGENHIFGRTFDYERSFGQQVVSLPRHFFFGNFTSLYSIIGIAAMIDDMPLFFDGMNEEGLCGAALNFPFWSEYHKSLEEKINLASYELIAYVLGTCKNLNEARKKLEKVNITSDSIREDLPPTPLHWIFADAGGALVVESIREGVKIYENPHGVLANSPPFDYHLTRVSDFLPLHSGYPEKRLVGDSNAIYSRGMGALGLPGDFSSSSRFVRALFLKKNVEDCGECPSVTKFFHVMDAVSIPYGVVKTEDDMPVSTIYTCCMDTRSKKYYFTTYFSRRIRAIRHNPDDKGLRIYPMDSVEDIDFI